ncbi:GIY-YIG nuclease family protein [Thiomonas sp. FB-Cd]|uniref:GIY-YIG nuclease family protein n=1 Tax=Thiomonas sp. FB-Cd TaxID=1158292 RepID=UPI0004DED300|nr:GIY-YIG nuclease family protein [Thiomonas sp. FB-Cd]
MEGFAEFEFDLPRALKAELIGLLDGMETGPLQQDVTSEVPEAQGVYQLFYGNTLVYVGKTDAEAGLRTRLSRHARKILHRPTLTGAVSFKAVRIMVFTAMDLETQLIKHYRETANGAAAWNGSGFGSNDPGRQRETTNKSPEGFDAQHPINIDLPAQLIPPGTKTAAAALAELKVALPYTLRYETLRNAQGRAQRGQPHADLLTANVTIPEGSQTVRGLMRIIRTALGTEWQATAFVSHVILYKEQHSYQYGEVII